MKKIIIILAALLVITSCKSEIQEYKQKRTEDQQKKNKEYRDKKKGKKTWQPLNVHAAQHSHI